MKDHSKEFIRFALEHDVLRFGEFTLKSGRISPYFFNAGLFNTGLLLQKLGAFYADAIKASQVEFDVLFGPAYKGIPLVASTVIALQQNHHINKPYAFNRKEVKDHGEGGNIIGSPIKGRVLIIDDVITAGTAFHEAKNIIESQGGIVAGIAVALDRQERGQGDLSAIDEIKQRYKIPVISITCLEEVLQFCELSPELNGYIPAIKEYQKRYRSVGTK